jgi:hypothetical protein
MHKTLAALTGAALALPGVAPEASAGVLTDAQFNASYFYYDESGKRMTVKTFQQNLAVPLNDYFDVTFNGVRDAISGASPIYSRPEIECANAAPAPVKARARMQIAAPKAAEAVKAMDTVSGASGVPQPPPIPRPSIPTPPSATPSPGVTPPTATPKPGSGAGLGGVQQQDCRVAGITQVLSRGGFQDVRDEGGLRLNFYHGDTTLGIGGGVSRETDYASDFVSVDLRQDINDKMTTLAFGWSLASDEYSPVTMKGFTGDKKTHQFLLGATQILDKNTFVQANFAYTYGHGYLTDPYKYIYVRETNSVVQERRPDERHQWNWLLRYVHYFPEIQSSLHLDYRFTLDNWGLDAHTFEAAWVQPLGDGWEVTPGFRYYSQNALNFYRSYFDALPANGHYSSDYRVAGFGAVSGGVRLSKAMFNRFRIDAGVEFYEREADLKLGDNRDSGFADYGFVMYSLGMNLTF